MVKVIFACVHNAGRSQMAASFFNLMAPQGMRAISAGTSPALTVHPVVVSVMDEVGVNLRTVTPQKLSAEMLEHSSLLITMGCGESCPYVAGLETRDWKVPDPKNLDLEDAREVRNEIRRLVGNLLSELGA